MSRIRSVSSSPSSAVACRVWPSCQRNSVVRRNGRVTFSQRTMLAHWLIITGRSRQERTHFASIGQMMASEVGRMASGSSSSSPPPTVTQAHSGEKPSTCSFSRSRKLLGMRRGK
jgi:hypothetical protein